MSTRVILYFSQDKSCFDGFCYPIISNGLIRILNRLTQYHSIINVGDCYFILNR